MKRTKVFTTVLFVSIGLMLSSLFWLGCKKTDYPLGVYNPGGFDVPSPTPLPLTGAIVVNVSDGPSVVPNLTVQAIEPGNAITLTAITNGGGQASFNPNPLPPGIWTIQIPTQTNVISNYDLSQQFVTIGPDFTNATISFVPGAFSSSISAVAGNSYPTTLQNNLYYTVAVSQTGTLSVPETFTFSGMPYAVTGGPMTFDINNPQQSVTVQIPSCSNLEPVFYCLFNRTGGSAIQSLSQSNSVTIQRGYPVSILSITHDESPDCVAKASGSSTIHTGSSMNDTWEINTSGGCTGRAFNVHVAFSSTNNTSSSNPSNETFILYSGTPYTFNWTPTTTSPVNYAVTVTDQENPSNVFTSSFVFDPHFGGGGTCNCGNGGYTGCQSTIAIPAFNNLLVNP